jgi:hypothetical protein
VTIPGGPISNSVITTGPPADPTVIPTLEVSGAITVTTAAPPEILTEITRGPQGIPGPAGDATLYYEAGQILSGHRVVMIEDDKAYYADCTIPSHGKRVLGITTGASVIGVQSRIQASGEMSESSWAWILDAPVWLGINGLLSQTPPVSGFSLIVGFPISSTKLLIRISEPLFLI